MRKIDHAGKRFGRLTVLRQLPPCGRNAYWVCRCDCGRERAVCAGHLTTGKITTCGCQRARIFGDRMRTHGMRRTAEYNIWCGMKRRCAATEGPEFPYYGARGIMVFRPWRDSFERFLRDVGRRPSPQHTIDRINNDGHYEPGNVRWATKSQQAFNRRPKSTPPPMGRLFTFDGETHPAKHWMAKYEIASTTFYRRVRQGRSPIS